MWVKSVAETPSLPRPCKKCCKRPDRGGGLAARRAERRTARPGVTGSTSRSDSAGWAGRAVDTCVYKFGPSERVNLVTREVKLISVQGLLSRQETGDHSPHSRGFQPDPSVPRIAIGRWICVRTCHWSDWRESSSGRLSVISQGGRSLIRPPVASPRLAATPPATLASPRLPHQCDQ